MNLNLNTKTAVVTDAGRGIRLATVRTLTAEGARIVGAARIITPELKEPHEQGDWMFCAASGRFLNPESVSQLFDRIVRRSSLPRIRFHDLRHTHASLLVAAGVPIEVVSERLGHAHPALTMHTDQHLLPGMSAAAVEQFAALVATSSR